jgi:hypothetical protein
MRRMRVSGWIVQPEVYADDGEILEPVATQPMKLTTKQWEAFKAGGDDAALMQIRAQIEAEVEGPKTRINVSAKRDSPGAQPTGQESTRR